MAKLRKVRRRKTYRHNVNRKRLRNKTLSKGKLTCKEIKEAWDHSKSLKGNMENMGLSYDPNKSITVGFVEEVQEEKPVPSKAFVAEELEKEAKAPRQKCFQLPKSQVRWITYLMDKYDTDYKAMVRDKKNYYQETWKQLRAKIETFKKVPEQYSKYLAEKSGESQQEEQQSDTEPDE